MLGDIVRAIAGGAVGRWREGKARRAMCAKYPEVEFEYGAAASGDCKFGPGVLILTGAHVHQVTVGPYTYFSSGSYIQNCTVGAYCSIGPRVRIGLGEHPTRGFVSTYPGFYSPEHVARAKFGEAAGFHENKSTTIGNDVWLGEGSMIMDGVTVGNGAIVGAGAIVTKDVPAYTVVAGIPARAIRQRFTDEQIEFLERLAWWDRDHEWIRAHAHLFQDIEKLMQSVQDGQSQ